jgi:hypothetical membrane protein
MARYPGGTALDRSSPGYSPAQNFLSDLGMTVAYGGQPNRLGAFLFILSLVTLVVGLGGCLVEFLRVCSTEPRPRRLARAASAVGLLVVAAFVGVAVTPENRVMALHVRFTLFAWRVFPVLTLFLALASLSSSVMSRGVTIAWAGLTVILLAYVLLLGWGPSVETLDGLRVQVVAQKIVVVAVVSISLYLSIEGNRAAGRTVGVAGTAYRVTGPR